MLNSNVKPHCHYIFISGCCIYFNRPAHPHSFRLSISECGVAIRKLDRFVEDNGSCTPPMILKFLACIDTFMSHDAPLEDIPIYLLAPLLFAQTLRIWTPRRCCQ